MEEDKLFFFRSIGASSERFISELELLFCNLLGMCGCPELADSDEVLWRALSLLGGMLIPFNTSRRSAT